MRRKEHLLLGGCHAILEEYPINYNSLEEVGFSQSRIDTTLQTCFKQITSLAGFAKFAALLYKSKRCPDSQRLNYLLQAKTQAEQIATTADPQFSSGLFLWDIGSELFELEQYEKTIASYDQAVQFKPDDHQAWNNRGNTLGNLERYEEAIASYDQAVQTKPDDYQAWYNRGVALDNLERYQEAIASYDQALTIKPDDANTFYNKACCYALQENIELAIENLQQAINLDEENREMAKTDSDFDRIRLDVRFQELVNS